MEDLLSSSVAAAASSPVVSVRIRPLEDDHLATSWLSKVRHRLYGDLGVMGKGQYVSIDWSEIIHEANRRRWKSCMQAVAF